MSFLDPKRKTIWMNICDVSSKLATVEFDPPQKILKRDIEHFQILLWEIGKTRTFEQLKKVGSYTKLVFQNKIDDKLSEAYTIHNLNHSTAYRVQISLVFKPQNERTFDYWKSLQLPNGDEEVMFNTAQQQIDEYIEKEMNFARETKREKSRKIQFAQSERVLYDFGNDQDQDYLYKKNTDHANKESLTQALYAARNHKSWKDFSKCGMKFSQPEYNKDKRLNRMLLVGNVSQQYKKQLQEYEIKYFQMLLMPFKMFLNKIKTQKKKQISNVIKILQYHFQLKIDQSLYLILFQILNLQMMVINS